jgi:5'-nucleotidase / UDP-sugar diphosphatase
LPHYGIIIAKESDDMIWTKNWRAQFALMAMVLTVAAGTVSAAPEYRAITILHTNDTHGHLIPFSYPGPEDTGDKNAPASLYKNIGGIARRATLAKQIAAQMHGDVILMDAGDVTDGTPFSVEYGGEADLSAMNAAGYTVMTVGNHEFNMPLKAFYKNEGIPTFPVVSANLTDRNTGKIPVRDYTILNLDGVKVAVFGLTVQVTGYKTLTQGVDIADPIETAKRLVPELRKQADIVVALTHLGYDTDLRLAREVPEIDVVVGGHSHTRLTVPTFVENAAKVGPFSIGGTLVTQDGQWGGTLGRLDLRLRRDGGPFTVMGYKGEFIPVTSDIADDPATEKVLDKYYKPIAQRYGQFLGTASASFRDDRTNESTVMNLVCDAVREATSTDVCVYNTGGVRADIAEGPIKMWDVATVMPFANKIIVLEMTGARIKKALAELKPGVSGIRYKVENDKLIEATIGGQPIVDDKVYKVSTNDWFDGYGFKDIDKRTVLDLDPRDAIKNFVTKRGTIAPSADGRRVVVGSPAPV